MTTPLRRSPVEIKQYLRELKLLRRPGQNLRAAIGQDDEVFDANAPEPREIHAWLDAEYHPRLEGHIAAGTRDPWRLVDLQSDPVSEPMDEFVPVTGVADHTACDGVDLGAGHARLHALLRLKLRVENDAPNLAQLVGRRLDAEGPRHVGTVSPKPRANVEEHQLVRANRSIGWDRVRDPRVRAGDRDRVERYVFRPMRAVIALDLPRQVALAPTRRDVADDVRKGRVVQRDRR